MIDLKRVVCVLSIFQHTILVTFPSTLSAQKCYSTTCVCASLVRRVCVLFWFVFFFSHSRRRRFSYLSFSLSLYRSSFVWVRSVL